MVLDMLADVHKISFLAYLGLRRQHQLVWTLPGPSNLFSSSNEDVVQFSMFNSLLLAVNRCTNLVVHSSVQYTEIILISVL
ncbi:hypothetical protein F511_38129 [Dorcoceras hygrometricum]|uniref:Uncharacterized protein n=1 Tax=Dorcoceras hygrometricum TaxID=472368 RepID=A0A2Z7AGL7_9LAMI|nr:hypothetical protein F511_38129 [Dorcoceras hygrometricum]